MSRGIVTGRMRRWRQRLTGPTGRRVLVALAVAAAWLAWPILPPRPLREWTAAARDPAEWRLTPDRTRLVYVDWQSRPPMGKGYPDTFGPIRVWDLATGRERLTAWADSPAVHSFSFHAAPEGSWLLTVRQPGFLSETHSLQVWDTETGRERWSAAILPKPWTRPFARYVVSPDGRFVACRRQESGCDVLHAATGHVYHALGDVWPLAFAPDSQTLVVASLGDDPDSPLTASLWDVTFQRWRGSYALNHRSPAAAAVSPDGRWLAVGLGVDAANPNWPEVVELWDLRTGQRTAELNCGFLRDNWTNRQRWDTNHRDMQFSSNGSLLFVPSPVTTRDQAWLWDVTQSPPQAIDSYASYGGSTLRFSNISNLSVKEPVYPLLASDGARFVAPTVPTNVLGFRETTTPERVVRAPNRGLVIDAPVFAPDGRTLAVLHQDWFQPLWQQAIFWVCQKTGLSAPSFQAKDRCALTFFDATTGAERGRLNHFPEGTHLIGFGPAGRTVWTLIHTADPTTADPPETIFSGSIPPRRTGDGTLRVQEWAVPTGWPPAWLLAVTALGVLLAAADWRRKSR